MNVVDSNNSGILDEQFPIDTNFQTPPAVCEYMASLIPNGTDRILEPTPGTGNLFRAIKSAGFKRVYTPNDFFLLDTSIERFDCIVMNPPFSSKSAYLKNAPDDMNVRGMRVGYFILTECMKMSDEVIALMPWFTISDSDLRLNYLNSFGLVSLTALPRKTFQYARIQTVVIHLKKGWSKETVFKTFRF